MAYDRRVCRWYFAFFSCAERWRDTWNRHGVSGDLRHAFRPHGRNSARSVWRNSIHFGPGTPTRGDTGPSQSSRASCVPFSPASLAPNGAIEPKTGSGSGRDDDRWRDRRHCLVTVTRRIAHRRPLPAVTWWRSSGLPKRTRYAWYLWAGAVLVGGSLIVLLPNRLGWRRDDFASSALMAFEYRTGTGRGRIIQAQTTSRIIHDAPVLGVGPGNWSIVYPAYARASDPSVKLGAFYPAPRIPRNDILSFGAEFGAPGVALGIVALIALLGRAVLMLRSSDMVTQQSGLMIFGVSAAAGLLGFFDSIIRVAPTLGLLAVMLGLAVGEGTARTSLQRNAGRGRHFGQRTMLVGYACASFVLARSALQDIATLRVLESARTIEDLHRAVRVAPNNVEARMLLALVLAGAGRCDLARPHVARAALLQPFSGAVRSLRLRCDISMRQP